METVRKLERIARRLPSYLKFRIMQYVVMNLFLVLLNYVTSPNCWWVVWVVFGWGLSLSIEIISWYYTNKEEKR